MLISFRPTKKVINYLKPLKNKSKEINDILEMYIIHWAVKKNWVRYTDWFVNEFWIAQTNTMDEALQDIKLDNEIKDKLERESQLFDDIEPVEEIVKDKKYYDNLNKYTTIKNMWWCFSATWERMDTQEALAYANLLSFTP